MLLIQAFLVVLLFIVFIAVWVSTESKGWRVAIGILMLLSVVAVAVSVARTWLV